jgi:type IV pilus biogenesis protein PilP
MSALIRLAGAGTVLGLVGLAFASVVIPQIGTELPEEAAATSAVAAFAPLPPVNDKAGGQILEASPFVSDRSAFDRATASAPAAVPVEVKLTGIFRVGKELRASLNVGGQALVVREGDETPAGKVEKISAGSVTLSGPPERSIAMFK